MKKIVAVLALSAAAVGLAGSFAASIAWAQDQPPQMFTVRVMPGDMGLLGPDGLHHDSIEPANFVFRNNVPVTLQIVNYDDAAHTMFATGLPLLATIKPGIKEVAGAKVDTTDEVDQPRPEAGVKPVVTIITFTPTKTGQFRWDCLIPCDGGKTKNWSMSPGTGGAGQPGFMAGTFTVL